jgi:hypothetical protein
MKVKAAIYRSAEYGYECLFTYHPEIDRATGTDMYRVSEWVEIEFPMLDPRSLTANINVAKNAKLTALYREIEAIKNGQDERNPH